jgi:predicted lipid-binding transport protein (Tim44 family)
MVEATPLNLTYTIYPGEKFFDGQLVAVEENRLVFRRVVKMSNGKFVSSVENKPLRKYTDREQIQGTAPVENDTRAATAPAAPASQTAEAQVVKKPAVIMSPLDEMNRQGPAESEKEKTKKDSKKPVKVAKSK